MTLLNKKKCDFQKSVLRPAGFFPGAKSETNTKRQCCRTQMERNNYLCNLFILKPKNTGK